MKHCLDCGNQVKSQTAKRCWTCYRKIIWKGGTHITPWGYIRDNKTGKFVHVLVLEKKLGRKLLPTERTHHINGIKTDNRPDNLRPVSITEHNSIHKPHLGNMRHPSLGMYVKRGKSLSNYSIRNAKRDSKTGRFIG